MASSSTQRASPCKYHVFLSFRGADTRRSFTDHLYAALIRKGIDVFRDDKELEKGKSISELLKAIEESRISIVVFSKNYAYSKWCLDELVKIVECKNASNHLQLVYPIFYEAEPTVTSIFKQAFVKHEQDLRENTEKLQKWKDAFEEVAHISGWELKDRNESEFISDVVNEISSKIPIISQILKDLVGIDSHLEKMRYLINEKPRDVRMIGICGMGGIGKTTLARVAYDLFSHEFEGSCFLAHVREISERKGSVRKLQKQLISKLLKVGDNIICSVYDGIEMIASRLPCKKVLVVIDDVTDLKQLEGLAGKHEWFGPGSRIIITSRDGHLLKTHGVDEVYKLMVLHKEEARQLFCTKAFKTHRPLEEYVELCGRVIKHAGGLPLALKVLGCYLSGRTKEEWESAITKLEIAPHKDIQEVLKISYDGLDDFDKNIFLDIAFVFGGENHINMVESFLLGVRGSSAKIGLKVLIDRSLVTLSRYDSISMHDLLRDMGREIVRKEYINDPGKRSRLWHHEDIYKVLKENTETRHKNILYPRNEIPKWFMFQSMGSSRTWRMPAPVGFFNKLIGIAFCVILQFPQNAVPMPYQYSPVCEWKVKYEELGESVVLTAKWSTGIRPERESDNVKLKLFPFNFDREDMRRFGNCDGVIEIFFKFSSNEVAEWCKVKKCGAHLFWAQEEEEEEEKEEPHSKRLKHSFVLFGKQIIP